MVRLAKKVLLGLAIAIATFSVDAAVHNTVQTAGSGLNVNSAGSIGNVNVGIGFSGSQVALNTNKGSGVAAGGSSAFGVGVNNGGAGFVSAQSLNSVSNEHGLASSNQGVFRGGQVVDGDFTISAGSVGNTEVGKNEGASNAGSYVNIDGGSVELNHGNTAALSQKHQEVTMASNGGTSAGNSGIGILRLPSIEQLESKENQAHLIHVGILPIGNTVHSGVIGSTSTSVGHAGSNGLVVGSGEAGYGGQFGFSSSVAGAQLASQSSKGQSIGYGVGGGSGLAVGDWAHSGGNGQVGFVSVGKNGVSSSSTNFGEAASNKPLQQVQAKPAQQAFAVLAQ